MSKRTKIIIVILILLAAVGIWYWLKKKKESTSAPSVVPQSNLNPAPAPVSVFPLQKGSVGKEVRQLQTWLYKQNGGSITKLLGPEGIDGKFGPNTESALNKTLGVISVDEVTFKAKGINQISA